MALKITYSKQDEIPEAVREYYTEQDDGTYRLSADGLRTDEEIQRMQEVMRKEREDRQKKDKELKELKAKFPEDFDPEEWKRLKEEEEARQQDPDEGGKKKSKGPDPEKIKAALHAEFAKKESSFKERITFLEQKIHGLVVDSGLTNALVAAKVADGPYLKAAKALLQNQVQLKEEDGEFKALVDGELGPQPVEEFVKKWAQSDEGKAFVEAPRHAGGGTPPSQNGGGKKYNPWLPTKQFPHGNRTEQARIMKENRQVGEQMKKEALATQT